MNPKHIYFVRHGESEANVNPKARSHHPLTEKGLEQAQLVAKRFKDIHIDKLIETSKVRSKQTAEAIGAVTGQTPILCDLFLERQGEFEAMYEHKHLPVHELTDVMRKKLDKPQWNYEEQELFENLKKRVGQAFEYLENLPEENIAVVTHGMFLKVLAAYLIFKDELTEEQAIAFSKGLVMQNTGITLCKFKPEEKRWKLLSWNDQSHLGEIQASK